MISAKLPLPSFCLPEKCLHFAGGEVNHFPAFLVHFPAENVDFTAISPFFPGKVNHIAANLVHFPPELGVAFSDNRSQSRTIAEFLQPIIIFYRFFLPLHAKHAKRT